MNYIKYQYKLIVSILLVNIRVWIIRGELSVGNILKFVKSLFREVMISSTRSDPLQRAKLLKHALRLLIVPLARRSVLCGSSAGHELNNQ